MIRLVKSLLFAALFVLSINAQQLHTIMSYNLLNYPGSDTTNRNPHFRTIVTATNPDILVVQEMVSLNGVNGFLNNVLNSALSGYNAGIFIDGPDTDNAIFYKSQKFTFLANNPISTTLRDVNEFVLRENISGDTIRIYSVHLKASSGSSNELQRLAEVTQLRNVTAALPANSNFIVLGDFNIYSSGEPAYQKLLDTTTSGYFVDIFTLPGSWNSAAYAQHHTQSTRTRLFGGGAIGGLDDRFDMILMSPSLLTSGGIEYVVNSYIPYGNDGQHYNDSINRPPNNTVGQIIANALHYASDHLPVLASFRFNAAYLELTSFTALIEGLYNEAGMIPDTVSIELRNPQEPYSLADETKILLDQNGNGTGRFFNAVNQTPYYLVLKHRNALETWSSAPLVFSGNQLTYDFTISKDKAFGDNLKLIGSKWCIYSGDINQDGLIRTDDLMMVFSDNIGGVQGMVITDLNRDGFVEIEDLNIVFTNNVLEIKAIRPGDF